MIKLEKVNKYFNRHKRNQMHIINNTSLELGDTGLVAILGQSGSGKTTLLNAIGGLDKVNRGKIYINGKKITRRTVNTVDRIRNLNIGYIFQDYKLIENLSVYENIAMALRMIGITNKKEIDKRVNYVLEAVKMERYKKRPALMLSGGEKQRVSIARALAKNPSIVIADEPTGNLDSKNSLEVMNIIKAISKEKLVILVTHEVDLAKFYASRILEIKDGKIVNDYENNVTESLEYRLDNKIYLKDFKNIENIHSENENLNVNIYSNEEKNKINVNVVIKDGNVYIEAKDKQIEVIDENSAIEFVDDHYKKIDKSIYEQYDYDLDAIGEKKYKLKYKSIYGIIKSLVKGFQKVFDYSILKKILMLGFFASSLFIVYAISNIYGVSQIDEKDFIEVDKNYLKAEMPKIDVDEFSNYENVEGVDYILPGDGNVSFQYTADDYIQTAKYTLEISGSMVSLDKIKEENIYAGRMAQNDYEILLDKMVLDKIVNDNNTMLRYMGLKNENELLNKNVSIDNLGKFTIVGFVNTGSPSIYVSRNLFTDILANQTSSDFGGIYRIDDSEQEETAEVKNYELYMDDITLVKGRLPENDYEVIVNESNKETMKLNKKIPEKVNGEELTVVGYYRSQTDRQDYLVNNDTIMYDIISKASGLMVYCNGDKQAVLNEFQANYHINIYDKYARDFDEYQERRKDSIKSSIILATIILAISLIEIFLMIRSSFLSRIKEIGVLRTIGVKKNDIYRMFIGEIFAITTLGNLPGIFLMNYILYNVSKISYFKGMFVVNMNTFLLGLLLVYAFNLIIGVIPIYKVLRKRPAEILARHDI